MHIKKLLVVPIISSLLITGCIKLDNGESAEKKEPPKQEEVKENLFEEEIKAVREAIMENQYKEAESILVLALAEDEDNEDLNTLYRQVKILIEIEEKIKDKKYDEARVRCTILLMEEKLDTVVKYEAERLQSELDKIDNNKTSSSNKNRNIKIDKNKDISPQKAMDIVREYIKKSYPGTKPQISIADMYSIDGQSYYYIYAYRIKNVGGYGKEEAIAYYDVNMRSGKLIEYLICNPNYKVNISEDKAIELSKKYMAKYTDYKAESFKVINIASDCGDTFYCIEAYGRDENNSLVTVGYFEVHVETGVVRGDIYPPEIKPEEPEVSQPPQDNNDENKTPESTEQPEQPEQPEQEPEKEEDIEKDTTQEVSIEQTQTQSTEENKN